MHFALLLVVRSVLAVVTMIVAVSCSRPVLNLEDETNMGPVQLGTATASLSTPGVPNTRQT